MRFAPTKRNTWEDHNYCKYPFGKYQEAPRQPKSSINDDDGTDLKLGSLHDILVIPVIT